MQQWDAAVHAPDILLLSSCPAVRLTFAPICGEPVLSTTCKPIRPSMRADARVSADTAESLAAAADRRALEAEEAAAHAAASAVGGRSGHQGAAGRSAAVAQRRCVRLEAEMHQAADAAEHLRAELEQCRVRFAPRNRPWSALLTHRAGTILITAFVPCMPCQGVG